MSSRRGNAGPPSAGRAGPRQLWLIDDSPDHHQVTAATARRADWDFTGFTAGAAALAALAAGGRPAVVLMDFFLGEERGDAITARWRQSEPAGHRATIVGFSSVRACSLRILAVGGDVVLVKRSGPDGINPDLLAWLTGQALTGQPQHD
jgi:CheY-like chemotaxis protein